MSCMSIRPWIRQVLPLKEDEFGAEGRAHGSEDAVGSGLAGGVDEDVFKNGEDGGCGEVADFAKALPGWGRGRSAGG